MRSGADEIEWNTQAAQRFAANWIANHLPERPHRYTYSQFHELMTRLAKLAIEECFHTGGGAEELATKLDQACSVLGIIQGATLGEKARYRSYAVTDSRTEESKRKEAEQALVVWRRRDVKAVFEEGLDHRDYFFIFRDNLLQAAADYLASSWMRNAEMDWIIVDALVTGEAILFGEEFKKKALAGPRDDLRFFTPNIWVQEEICGK